jgi:hypothetical protein
MKFIYLSNILMYPIINDQPKKGLAWIGNAFAKQIPNCIASSNTKNYIKVQHHKHYQNLANFLAQKMFSPKILVVSLGKKRKKKNSDKAFS